MSLSSVVSNLVRASMGTSVSNMVTDEDLDKHIAELILKEAKQKASRYSQDGVKAFLSNRTDSNAPKANKRFLSSIIKSTDEHNRTVLRAQAQAAEEVKRERYELERKERMAMAQDAVAARKMRLNKHHGDDADWDVWNGRSADRKRRSRSRERDDEFEEGSSRKRRRSRSVERIRRGERSERSRRSHHDDEHRKHRKRRYHSRSSKREHSDHDSSSKRRSRRKRHADDEDDSERPHRRRRSRSPSREKEDKSRHSRRSASHSLDHSDGERHSSYSRSEGKRRKTRTPPDSDDETRHTVAQADSSSKNDGITPGPSPPIRRSPSPLPSFPELPSKMDKYFDEAYDPRLDVAPLAAPKVPATGLVDNAEFEGWDAMLELIRIRREDKEEKKRMERLGLTKDKGKKSSFTDQSTDSYWTSQSTSAMDIEYKKKGSTREWDLGKDGL